MNNKRICVLSFRSRNNLAARCVDFEFEDVIGSIDDIDLITIEQGFGFSPRKRVVNQLSRHVSPWFTRFSPSLTRVSLKKNYDLFVAFCQDITDLLMVNSIRNWKQRSGMSICWIDEVWAAGVVKNRALCNRLLSRFDHVIIGCSGAVNTLQAEAQRPCIYLPPGVDTLKFSPPATNGPERNIDVYSIGRRPLLLHNQLLGMKRSKNITYLYDQSSNGPLFVRDYLRHRATMVYNLQRSKYFIVYPAKFDAPWQTHQQVEFGPRFFEGAAAGAVLIGQPAASKVFRDIFDWEDAVISLPEEEHELTALFDELESDTKRVDRIRRTNMRHCFLKHDWLYRWQEILDIAGMQPLPQFEKRRQELVQCAENVSDSAVSP